MKQKEFINQYLIDFPSASAIDALDAWNKQSAMIARQGLPKESITAFCKHQGISREAYYKNKKKWGPLYLCSLNSTT